MENHVPIHQKWELHMIVPRMEKEKLMVQHKFYIPNPMLRLEHDQGNQLRIDVVI